MLKAPHDRKGTVSLVKMLLATEVKVSPFAAATTFPAMGLKAAGCGLGSGLFLQRHRSCPPPPPLGALSHEAPQQSREPRGPHQEGKSSGDLASAAALFRKAASEGFQTNTSHIARKRFSSCGRIRSEGYAVEFDQRVRD